MCPLKEYVSMSSSHYSFRNKDKSSREINSEPGRGDEQKNIITIFSRNSDGNRLKQVNSLNEASFQLSLVLCTGVRGAVSKELGKASRPVELILLIASMRSREERPRR